MINFLLLFTFIGEAAEADTDGAEHFRSKTMKHILETFTHKIFTMQMKLRSIFVPYQKARMLKQRRRKVIGVSKPLKIV